MEDSLTANSDANPNVVPWDLDSSQATQNLEDFGCLSPLPSPITAQEQCNDQCTTDTPAIFEPSVIVHSELSLPDTLGEGEDLNEEVDNAPSSCEVIFVAHTGDDQSIAPPAEGALGHDDINEFDMSIVEAAISSYLSQITVEESVNYETIKNANLVTREWKLSPREGRDEPLPPITFSQSCPDSSIVCKGVMTLRTPADGWCMMHSVVGSYNLQIKPDNLLTLNTLSQDLYAHMIKKQEHYMQCLGLSKSQYILCLYKYFVKKDFNTMIGDAIPYALSEMLNVDIEIHEESSTRIQIRFNEEEKPAILVYKTNFHYCQVLIIEEASIFTYFGLKHDYEVTKKSKTKRTGRSFVRRRKKSSSFED